MYYFHYFQEEKDMIHYPREGGSIIQSGCTKVQNYMMQVYGWMPCGLLLTAFVAWYIANNSTLLFIRIRFSNFCS